MEYENKMLLVEMVEKGVALVTLNNPPLNVVTLPLSKEMADTFAKLEIDSAVKIVVLTGAGVKGFCAGSDLRELAGIRNVAVDVKLRQENASFNSIELLTKPTIAAIEGVVCGGGAEMAMCCDIRIISDKSRVGFPEIKLGVFPGSGGLWRLPRIVGYPKAVELMLLGELISASEAKEIGFANHMVSAGAVVQAAVAMAKKIAEKPLRSLRVIKAAARALQNKSLEECVAANFSYCDAVFGADDAGEGIAAFLEKRLAVFDDK
jgi:enoyl-CoA hydratase